ncbi:MAG: adenosylhomocysteinase [Firmicutes bacterium]|jgi:adenosylhomocysteinase|nr:adenosylhomocysteinase [Bacillota bacterium]HOB21225.1 adenosylhomocysteinase [Bacillota bacterium]HQD40008.1 adenosylhomocysteinase [Bacillota bacterium]
MNGHYKDPALAAEGVRRIQWAEQEMKVLWAINEEWQKTKPLKGLKIAACLHVTTETANLMRVLANAGAQVFLCASNPLSTQDDVAAALGEVYGIATYAVRGEDRATYYEHLQAVLAQDPHLTMDDGADLVSTLHSRFPEKAGKVLGGTEETTTGVIRLRAMAEAGELKYPIVAVNDAYTKHLFDNRYGTGQSTIDGILRLTNHLLAGKNFVVAGYGWCGKGLAMRARGMGANVIVTEVDPMKALEAVMDGYRVMPMEEAASIGDIFVTVTGNINVLDRHHFALMKDGAIVANSGHFDVEINVKALKEMSSEVREARAGVEEYTLDGRKVYLLCQGRLVNLAGAEGHPAVVMDLSFANQALSVHWLYTKQEQIPPQVLAVPEHLDKQIAELKLRSMGLAIDTLTPEQEEYLSSWQLGT